ncbi:MAG: hypothetical protein U0R68_04630 [Candidatus Nanopelagicales bacterium]
MTIGIQVLLTVIIGALLSMGAVFGIVQSQSAVPTPSDATIVVYDK